MSTSPGLHESVSLLTRRALLKCIIATWAGACTMSWHLAQAGAEPTIARPPAWLPNITGRPDAVLRVGGAYLEAHAAEKDMGLLLASIDRALAGLQGEVSKPPEDVSEMIDALKRVVRDEYIRDRVTLVQGWVVSLTEARLYALAAMFYSG